MNFKKGIMYTMIGGLGVYGYMKYKDGSITRMIKNIRPMMNDTIENLKK